MGHTPALAAFETPPVCRETKLSTRSERGRYRRRKIQDKVLGEITKRRSKQAQARRFLSFALLTFIKYLRQAGKGSLSIARPIFLHREYEGGKCSMLLCPTKYWCAGMGDPIKLPRHAHGVGSPEGEDVGGGGTQRAPSPGLAGPSFIHLSRSPRAVCGNEQQRRVDRFMHLGRHQLSDGLVCSSLRLISSIRFSAEQNTGLTGQGAWVRRDGCTNTLFEHSSSRGSLDWKSYTTRTSRPTSAQSGHTTRGALPPDATPKGQTPISWRLVELAYFSSVSSRKEKWGNFVLIQQ